LISGAKARRSTKVPPIPSKFTSQGSQGEIQAVRSCHLRRAMGCTNSSHDVLHDYVYYLTSLGLAIEIHYVSDDQVAGVARRCCKRIFVTRCCKNKCV
jgi:hypothetical protein